MTFNEALELVMHHGKKIRRPGWDEDLHICNHKDKLVYRCTSPLDGSEIEMKAVDFDGFSKDQKATDWEEVKE